MPLFPQISDHLSGMKRLSAAVVRLLGAPQAVHRSPRNALTSVPLAPSAAGNATAEPIVVTVEQGIADLVPLFLEQRKADQAAIVVALRRRDLKTIREVGHAMAGAGSSYGFDRVSELGGCLVQAARAANMALLEMLHEEFTDYMARLVVKVA